MTIFRSVLADPGDEDYVELAAQTEATARAMPGFVDFKTFCADDGERLSVAIFDSWANHLAWRDHPIHRRAQTLGKDRFFVQYSILRCELIDEWQFHQALD